MTEKIFVGIDNERVELTGEALDAYLADIKNIADETKAREDKIAATAAAKKALLERLGVTEEEAKLLLG